MHTEFSKDSQATKGEKQSIETRLQCLKFSRNLKEFKDQLQSNFNMFLEGHTSYVNCVAVTSDNKHIISGSSDLTIRV